MPKGKTKKGKKKSVKQEVENNQDEAQPVETKPDRFFAFELGTIKMQAKNWVMTMTVLNDFKKIYSDYEIRFVVDVAPIDERIEAKKKEKQEFEMNNQMEAFDEYKQRSIEEYDTSISNLMEERAALVSQCPAITFLAHVKSHDERGPMRTAFCLLIPDEIIEELITYKEVLDKYKIGFIKDLSNHDPQQ